MVRATLLACNFLHKNFEPEWFKWEKRMSDESDYYMVLGIPRNASETDIKKAYVLSELISACLRHIGDIPVTV